eukprot:6201270-Pleurochrysis_carterae.AAC.1
MSCCVPVYKISSYYLLSVGTKDVTDAPPAARVYYPMADGYATHPWPMCVAALPLSGYTIIYVP